MKNTVCIRLLIFSTILMPFLGFGQAKRIVSLSPTITQNLVILSGNDLVIGCTNYCNIAESQPDKVVASAIDVNIEKVLKLKPDLVLYSTLTKPQTVETLKSLGIKTHYLDQAKSYEVICNQFIEIGKLIGYEKKAQDIVNQCNVKKDSIINASKVLPEISLFFQIGAQPLFTVIPNTFMNDYITFLGCSNIASDQNYGTINREKVVAKNPDAIVIVTMGILSNEELQVWKQYAAMKAVKNNRLFVIDANTACEPTPYNFVETLSILNNLLINSQK